MSGWLEFANRNQLWIAAAALCLILGLERLWPRRQAGSGGWPRWGVTLVIAALGIGFTGLAQPFLLKLASAVTNSFPAFAPLGLPPWPLLIASLLLIDLLSYGTHRLFHKVPWLWRLHKLHHSDAEFDATTGFLHHPLEAIAGLLMQFVILVVLAVLGVPLLAIILYAVVMQIQNPLSHGNLCLPDSVDRVLRLFVVTPDMHRVHHSVRWDEGNSNFGMLFPFWDRLFATYRSQPMGGHLSFCVGLLEEAAVTRPGLVHALLMPFPRRSKATARAF